MFFSRRDLVFELFKNRSPQNKSHTRQSCSCQIRWKSSERRLRKVIGGKIKQIDSKDIILQKFWKIAFLQKREYNWNICVKPEVSASSARNSYLSKIFSNLCNRRWHLRTPAVAYRNVRFLVNGRAKILLIKIFTLFNWDSELKQRRSEVYFFNNRASKKTKFWRQ